MFSDVSYSVRTSWPLALLHNGDLATDLLFVLSGALMHHMLARELARRGRVGFGTFVVRRLMRLWPAYVVVAPLYLIHPGQREACDRWGVANVLMVNNMAGPMDAPVPSASALEGADGGMAEAAACMGHTWTVATLCQLYALTPALVWLMYTRRVFAGRLPSLIPGVVCVASAVIRAVVYAHNLREATNGASTPSLPAMEAATLGPWLLFTPAYTRAGAFCLGLLASHYRRAWMHKLRTRDEPDAHGSSWRHVDVAIARARGLPGLVPLLSDESESPQLFASPPSFRWFRSKRQPSRPPAIDEPITVHVPARRWVPGGVPHGRYGRRGPRAHGSRAHTHVRSPPSSVPAKGERSTLWSPLPTSVVSPDTQASGGRPRRRSVMRSCRLRRWAAHATAIVVAAAVVMVGPVPRWTAASTHGSSDADGRVAAAVAYVACARTLFAASAAWLVCACGTGRAQVLNRALSCRAWLPLARLSYAMYLLQFVTLVPTLRALDMTGAGRAVDVVAMMLPAVALTFVTSLIAGLALYLGVEKPFMRLRPALAS